MKDIARIVFCTTSSEKEARLIARTIVEKRLAACCSIVPRINSIYRWKEKIEEDTEWMIVIKTASRKYEQLEKEIKMLHSYSVPEILSFQADKGSQAYIDWLLKSTDI